MHVGNTLKSNGKNLLGPACARLIWVLEALSTKDRDGSYRKAFHEGVVHGAKLVSDHFPLFPSNNAREEVTITVREE